MAAAASGMGGSSAADRPTRSPSCSADRSTLPGETVLVESSEEVASRLRSVPEMPAWRGGGGARVERAVDGLLD